jgi:hypothetical protein
MTAAQYTSHSEGFNKANDSWMLATHNVSTNTNIKDNGGDGSWGAKMTTEQGSGCGYGANYGYPFYIDRHLYETIPSTDCRKKCFVDFAVDTYTKKVTDPKTGKETEVMDTEKVLNALKANSDYPELLAMKERFADENFRKSFLEEQDKREDAWHENLRKKEKYENSSSRFRLCGDVQCMSISTKP